jgi:hypothetical protein
MSSFFFLDDVRCHFPFCFLTDEWLQTTANDLDSSLCTENVEEVDARGIERRVINDRSLEVRQLTDEINKFF